MKFMHNCVTRYAKSKASKRQTGGTYTHTHTHTPNTHIDTHAQTHTHTHTHTQTHTHTRTNQGVEKKMLQYFGTKGTHSDKLEQTGQIQ